MLDTHFAVWLTSDPGRLTVPERAAIERPGRELLLSTIAIWEVRMKWEAVERKGKPHGVPTAAEVVALARAYDIEIVPLSLEDHLAQLVVPLDHNDPFDAMMLVHAQQVGAKLLTRHDHLRAHPLSLPL